MYILCIVNVVSVFSNFCLLNIHMGNCKTVPSPSNIICHGKTFARLNFEHLLLYEKFSRSKNFSNYGTRQLTHGAKTYLDGSETAALECGWGEQGWWEAGVRARGRDGGPAVEEEVEQGLHAGPLHPHHRLGPVVNVNPTRALTG